MSVEAPTAARIRSALPADLEICATLDHSTSTDHVWQMEHNDFDGRLSISFRTARLPRSMRVRYPRSGAALQRAWNLDDCFLVAELMRGNKVVGYVNVREQNAQEIGWVADLVVDKDHREQGIGTSLLRAAINWAHKRNLQRVVIETATKNYPAICFLQKSGLVFCGYNDLYYPNHDIAVFFGQPLR